MAKKRGTTKTDKEPKKKEEVDAAEGGSFASRVPPLAAYLHRVGAEELNFRRYMVKEYKGGGHYYTERCLIRIGTTGEITCTRKEYEPTEAEAKAIAEAFIKHEVPRSVEASEAEAEEHQKTLRGSSFLFYSRSSGGVIMIQERFIPPSGGKVYIPWTFWSDGEWRRMEPDGDLPFWKPPKDRGSARKMVHEGAKAAAYCDALVNDPEMKDELAAHPWGDTLRQYEHWGMIGGALAPHRAAYGELVREKPTEVVYVCDKDFAGESALQEVSRHYGQSMRGVMFGDKFPASWDMADAFPEDLFVGSGKKRRYVGPRLEDLMMPATFATEVTHVPNPSGRGRPSRLVSMRRSFREEWFHAIRPEVFVHRDWPHEMWTLPEFNSKVRPFSDVDDTARLLKTDAASKSAVLLYDPSQPPGVYASGEAGRYINTHRPSPLAEEAGSAAPFLEFMEHLVPDKTDREELMRWVATLIARPDVKMNYGVLLISEMQGVGKGTLGEKILAPLVGEINVSYPSEQEIVDSNYNYWLAHKRLAVVHEIYSGHSSKAYNRLKSVITDRFVTVSKKYMANYDIVCWIHVFACSNSMRAIQLTMDDRRWYLPRITEKKKPRQYWTAFNRWLAEEGGLGIVKRWAREFVAKHGHVERGADAPWSALKKEVVEEGYSPGMTLVSGVLEHVNHVLSSNEKEDVEKRAAWMAAGQLLDGKVILLDTDMVKLITEVVHMGRQSDRLERPLTIRKLAKGMGWHVGKHKVSTGMKTWGGSAANGRIITNCAEIAEMTPAELGGARADGVRLRPLTIDWLQEV